MINNQCPNCSKRHRKFPQQCYYSVHADYVFSQLGMNVNEQFKKESFVKWEKMKQQWGEEK